MTTYRQARNARFQRGSGVYQCGICHRMTRDTGGDGAGCDLCDDCFTLAGIDNHLNDNGVTLAKSGYAKEVERCLAHIEKLGGDVARVKEANDFVFPQ